MKQKEISPDGHPNYDINYFLEILRSKNTSCDIDASKGKTIADVADMFGISEEEMHEIIEKYRKK